MIESAIDSATLIHFDPFLGGPCDIGAGWLATGVVDVEIHWAVCLQHFGNMWKAISTCCGHDDDDDDDDGDDGDDDDDGDDGDDDDDDNEEEEEEEEEEEAIDTINVSKCLFAHQLRVVGPQNALSKKSRPRRMPFQETGSPV